MIVGEGNYTEIVTGETVRQKLLNGSLAIAKAVGTTFGPHGHNVAITKTFNVPHVTKDGVTVAKDLKLEDPVENVALQIIKGAAQQTAKKAGDGTTSTTLIASKLVEKAGALESLHIREIQDSLNKIVKRFIANTDISVKEVSTEDEIGSIAMVASNGDKEISSLVKTAFAEKNTNKVIVRDSDTSKTTLTVVDGIRMDATSMIQLLKKTEYKEPKILVTNCDVKGLEGAQKIIQLYQTIKTPLIVVGNDIDERAGTILNHAKQEGIEVDIVRGPHIAEARTNYLRVLATAVGAVFIDSGKGWTFGEVLPEQLGQAEAVVIDYQETVILGRATGLEKTIEEVQAKIDGNKDGLAQLYKDQLSVLDGRTAVIHVGASSEVELREVKDRIDDTVRAVEAALTHGMVRGALLAYVDGLTGINMDSVKEEQVMNMVKESINELRTSLLSNNNGEEIWNKDVMDPALVVTEAFKNAVSAASLIMTTDCVIVKKEFTD